MSKRTPAVGLRAYICAFQLFNIPTFTLKSMTTNAYNADENFTLVTFFIPLFNAFMASRAFSKNKKPWLLQLASY